MLSPPGTMVQESVKPGKYTILNCETETFLDLSGYDNRAILGFPYHGWENQQWDIEPLGAGFSIRSVHSRDYLTLDYLAPGKDSQNWALVCSPYPVAWEFEPEGDSWRICWPESELVFSLEGMQANGASQAVLIPLHLKPDSRCHLWKLGQCGDLTVSSSVATPSSHTVVEVDGLRITSTLTTHIVVL
ncbi:hypothetical protein DL96DRAFT_1617353 [Flagelloscypha sp. PMI_526]|nr:hypothetical protein DL96DRAFT_1617353 [Flagelloscypha sp. PMI_526]